jgi:hypothetical protein
VSGRRVLHFPQVGAAVNHHERTVRDARLRRSIQERQRQLRELMAEYRRRRQEGGT